MMRRLGLNRVSGFLSYAVAVLALLGVLTLALAPLSRSLVEQWSHREAESRARLAATSIQGPVTRALADNDKARLANILSAVTQDERILAVGLCDENGKLRSATADIPPAFSCNRVARRQ